MVAAVMNSPLLIEQGATWDFSIVWKTATGEPMDLSNCHAKMQFRQNFNSPVVLDLDTNQGTLTIDTSTARISAEVSACRTAGIRVRGGVFDLEVYHPNGRVDRVLQGRWVLSREVTK